MRSLSILVVTLLAVKAVALSQPLVVVTNGSAFEGYWSVHYLLKTGRVRVRATVRNIESSRARILQDLSVDGRKCEVIQAANNDKEALTRAFDGATSIYATTVYNVDRKKEFDPDNMEEVECGRAMINAAKETKTLKHFMWQTMMRFKTHPPEIGLEIPVHYKTKWEMEEEIKESNLPWIFLRQPAYMRQMRFMMNGKRRFKSCHTPDNRMGLLAEEDIGKIVAGILTGPNTEKFLGTTVNGISDLEYPPELARRASKVVPRFSSKYKKNSRTFNKILFKMLGKFVGGPVFPYVGAITDNFGAGNALDMDLDDVKQCQELTKEFGGLTTYEDWLIKYDADEPHGDATDVRLQKKFQSSRPKQTSLQT